MKNGVYAVFNKNSSVILEDSVVHDDIILIRDAEDGEELGQKLEMPAEYIPDVGTIVGIRNLPVDLEYITKTVGYHIMYLGEL